MQEITIEPMTERFIVWRCLHSGPLSSQTIDQWPSDSSLPWETYRARNLPLLRKLIRTYGTCAILARDGDQVVGHLRFYPRAILSMEAGAVGMCLQQGFPAGCSEQLVEKPFPPLREIADKTLVVHCMMTGSPQQHENPYQRKGIATRMAGALIAWAREQGWGQIEAGAFEDLPLLYAFTGAAGKSFWERLGFVLVATRVEPELGREGDLLRTLREQAAARGMDPEKVMNLYTMRLIL